MSGNIYNEKLHISLNQKSSDLLIFSRFSRVYMHLSTQPKASGSCTRSEPLLDHNRSVISGNIKSPSSLILSRRSPALNHITSILYFSL